MPTEIDVTLAEMLNKAYADELKAFRGYLHAVGCLVGPMQDQYKEILKKFAEQELHHMYELGEKIVVMGGIPSTECVPITEIEEAVGQGYDAVLSALEKYENGAIDLYKEIIIRAEDLGDRPLVLLIEEILLEEEQHDDELERLLMDTPNKVEVHEETYISASNKRRMLLKDCGILEKTAMELPDVLLPINLYEAQNKNPTEIAKALIIVVNILLSNVKVQYREKFKGNIKRKFNTLNTIAMSSKHTPPTARIGQAITIIKNLLNGQESTFINEVVAVLMRYM